MSILVSVLALALVLSIVVFVHEAGHFFVAKAFGFPVEVFSFGFGKRLFGIKRRGTDYRVSLLPLGGYVRVVGLGPDESTVAEGRARSTRFRRDLERDREAVARSGEEPMAAAGSLQAKAVASPTQSGDASPRVLSRQGPSEAASPVGEKRAALGIHREENHVVPAVTGPRWQRALILLAGPGMNLILAVVLQTAVFAVGIRVAKFELEPPVIGTVEASSPAEEAGLRVGDRILSIDGHPMETWREVIYHVTLSARSRLSVEVGRGPDEQERSTLVLTPLARGKYDYGYAGFGPKAEGPLTVTTVTRGWPAEAGGIRRGDVIVAAAGSPVRSREVFVEIVQQKAPGPFPLTVERDGRMVEISVSPRRDAGAWRVGVELVARSEEVLEKFPLDRAFLEGWRRVKTDFRLTILVVRRLLSGTGSMKQMSGPIDIARFSGEAARSGAVPLVALMGAISLQLGILNLLPIPVLDGGHLFLLSLEGIARRDFSLKVKERVLQVGFLLLIVLMTVVLYHDLAKNLPAKWWPF